MPQGFDLRPWQRVRRWLNSGPTRHEIDRFEDWAVWDGLEDIRVDVSQDTPDAPREKRLDDALAATSQTVSLIELPTDWVPKLAMAKCILAQVHVQRAGDGRLVALENLTVKSLNLPSGARYRLVNCRIGRLYCQHETNVEFIDTWVSALDVGGIEHFFWKNGYLGRARFDKSAITGDARFNGLYLNRSPARHGTQWLRVARAGFTENQNLAAAGAFHATELIHDRREQPLATRLVSVIYEAGSNFGGSIGRAAMWVAVILFCIFVIAYQGGVQASADASVGWQQELQGDGMRARGYRSAIYALNCVFNPLNLIVSKPLGLRLIRSTTR